MGFYQSTVVIDQPCVHFIPQLVINNAGVGAWEGLDEVDTTTMVSLFTTNTLGPLLVTQQLHKLGLIGPPGSIVANMTSKVNRAGGYAV